MEFSQHRKSRRLKALRWRVAPGVVHGSLPPPSAATALMAAAKLVGQQPVLKPRRKCKIWEACDFGGHLEVLFSNALLPEIPEFLS